MLLIVSLMMLGILIGFFLFSRDSSGQLLKICGKVQQIATIILLFVMGAWLGGNSEFWLNVKTTGLYGFLFGIVTITFSIIGVFLVSKILTRRKKQ